jgi:hypothetical protein
VRTVLVKKHIKTVLIGKKSFVLFDVAVSLAIFEIDQGSFHPVSRYINSMKKHSDSARLLFELKLLKTLLINSP